MTLLLPTFATAGRAVQVTPLAPVTEADGRLGFDNVLPGSPAGSAATWTGLALAAGARIDRWELRWDRIEPRRGAWNFGADDAAVSQPAAAGMDVLGILIGTPAWATAPGQKPGNGVPRGLGLPVDDPRNLWATYVHATVRHFTGQVRAWEIWNEPDLAFFWSGNATDYAALVSVAYRVIKEIDPAATVVLAGMVTPDLRFFGQVLDALRTARPTPFDAVSWHAYGPAPALYRNLLAVRAALRARRLGLTPIWVTESGFPASNPAGEPRQAAYVLQTTAYALLAGAARVYIYRASDDTTSKQWGLMTAGGQPRMGYVAFQVAARYLSGVQDIVDASTGGIERIVAYTPARAVVIAWSKALGDARTQLPWTPGLQLVDWQGNVTAASDPGGSLPIRLPGATYNAGGVDPQSSVVGGPPTLAVEPTTDAQVAPVQSVLAPLSGAGRRVLIFNPSPAPATAWLQSLDRPDRVIAAQIPAGGLSWVDPALIGGAGNLLVRSPGEVSIAASSAAGNVPVAPAPRWYVPRAPGAMVVTNPSDATLTVRLRGYARTGRLATRATYRIPARGMVRLAPRGLAGSSVTVSGSSPFTLPAELQAVTESRQSWNVVRPARGRVTLFNPTKTPASVDLRFAGAPTVKSEKILLAPHQSFTAAVHGGRAAIVTASVGVVASAGPEAPVPASQSALALGSRDRLTVFNPSPTAAHLTLRIVRGSGSTLVERVIQPLRVVRPVTGSAQGTAVLLSSDVPVVATRGR